MNKFEKTVFYGGNAILLCMLYSLLIFLLRFLAPQVATFIIEVSPIKDYEHAFNYAIAIETSIFILTAIGDTRAGKWFIGVSIITQLLFMHGWDHILMRSVWENPPALSKGLRLFGGSLVFSIMSTIAMWYLSEKIKQVVNLLKAGPEQKAAKIEQEAASLEKRLFELEKNSANLQQILMVPHSGTEQKFECTKCTATFKSHLALNGHMRVHSEKETVTV